MSNKIKTILTLLLPCLFLVGIFGGCEKAVEEVQRQNGEVVTKENETKAEENTEDEIESVQDLVDGEYQFEEVDTSDWKTYRNEEMGFEVKIPRDWSLVKEENSIHIKPLKKNSIDKNGVEIIRLQDINEEPHAANFEKPAKNLKGFFEQDVLLTETCKIDETTVNDKKVHIAVITGFASHYSFFIEKEGVIYQFVFRHSFSAGEEKMHKVCINREVEKIETNLTEILPREHYEVLNSFEFLNP